MVSARSVTSCQKPTRRGSVRRAVPYKEVERDGPNCPWVVGPRRLNAWVRFNEADALVTGDGLFLRLTGHPTLPRWLGDVLFSSFLSEKSDNDKYANHLRSSAGVAVFAGKRADPANWFKVGRAYERFALVATALGVRTALVNQPVEVAAVRTQFAEWLGMGS
jgi:hypothetical protein